MGILSLLLFLIVAAACAFIAERLVPNKMPGGFIINAIVGIIGAWLGGSMMGHLGPDLAGVSLIPAIVGSAVFVFIASLVSGGIASRKA